MTIKDIRIGRIAGSGGPAPRTGTPRVPVSQAEGARKGGGPEGPEKELDRQMSGPDSSSDFLALWDVLAMPSGCRELKEAWNRILEHAEKIGADALDTLWEFYLDRLGELERKENPWA